MQPSVIHSQQSFSCLTPPFSMSFCAVGVVFSPAEAYLSSMSLPQGVLANVSRLIAF
jgi:hypothetical protein